MLGSVNLSILACNYQSDQSAPSPIPTILTSVIVLGRFGLPLIDGALAKFKSD
jgi:hypothetical protein